MLPSKPDIIDRFLVERANLARTQWEEVRAPDLRSGEVLVAIDRFALTSNNVTYALTGDRFGYWSYFPADLPLGAVPVWGLARIVGSRCDDLSEGERIYGFLPMASHLVLQPDRIRKHAFVDAADGRAKLPPTYNEYVRIDHNADYDPAQADAHLVLRPLFALAFFATAYLRENAFFGARQVLVSSASSKASLAIGCLLQQAGVRATGLTSPANRTFVEETGLFDRVVAYDEINALDPIASVYLDVAGNIDVLRAMHAHFDVALRKSILAGFTHGFEHPPAGLPGPAPELFFTPSHILALRASWGASVLRARLSEAQAFVFAAVGARLAFRFGGGRAAVADGWQMLLTGRVPPQDALLLSVRPPGP